MEKEWHLPESDCPNCRDSLRNLPTRPSTTRSPLLKDCRLRLTYSARWNRRADGSSRIGSTTISATSPIHLFHNSQQYLPMLALAAWMMSFHPPASTRLNIFSI